MIGYYLSHGTVAASTPRVGNYSQDLWTRALSPPTARLLYTMDACSWLGSLILRSRGFEHSRNPRAPTPTRIHRCPQRRAKTCLFSSMTIRRFKRACRRLNSCRSTVRVHGSSRLLCATSYELCLMARGMLLSGNRYF